ncbi:ribonuclease H-like domain-containing protein [Mycena latifolia]|nr:ribonuclease H-like domain-containing protein [Mycena latifolia]
MSQTPLHDRTNAFGLPTPPRPELPALSFNSQFIATNFVSSNENTTESPATVEPPRKRRKVVSDEPFSNKSDTEVWELSDEGIIEKQFARCTSDAWKHYRITLKRHAGVIIFIFQCKHNNPKHPENTRERSKMKQGSSKLGDTAKKCEQGRAEPAAKAVAVPYNEARHRAICAIRCAANKRPFASQDDHWYRLEVELLRPGTIPPSSKTVERDVGTLYTEYAKVKRARRIHTVVDGWTSPIDTSYLGCGLQWEQDGEVFFMVLEFIRYGLSKHLHLVVMDGAGNCNTTATNFVPLNPQFKGTPWRAYCFLHIIQLSGKMILSFFSKQVKRKKHTVKIAVSTKRVEEVVLDGTPAGADADADLDQLLDEDAAEAEAIRNQVPDGAARNEHDTAVVSKIRVEAIKVMADRGVVVSAKESKDGLQLIPRVCGLARKIHDSSPVASAFATIVDQDTTIVGQTRTLARQCASRWNTEYDTIDTALILEQPVRTLLKDKDLNLKAFKLTDDQWNLVADLRDVLECIKEPTLLFSRGGKARPLISEVIPALESLRRALNNAANSTEIANICRVAAYGGLLVLDKYLDIVPNCEAYEFAIVLSPNLKLDWFKQNGRSSTQIQRIRETIVAHYDELFKTRSSAQPGPTSAPPPPTQSRACRRFGDPIDRTPASPTSIPNDIHSYLDTPPLPSLMGKTVLQYWAAEKATQPDLAEMALTYCSAPATSVDGRNQCAWNQHSMSSQTFRQQMSVGAWSDAPFFDLDTAEQILDNHTRGLRGSSSS